MTLPQTTRTPHRFYPLVLLCEQRHASGTTSRWIEMNQAVGTHRSLLARHILFGRQVGKAHLRKGKPLMELPYRIEVNCWGMDGYRICGEVAECRCELAYLPLSVRYDQLRKPAAKAVVVNAEEIMDAELGLGSDGKDAG